jgi:tripartite-type tricarboxylate transporter receptor subunit TctC
MIRYTSVITVALIAALLPLIARAQSRYPERPTRVVIPFAPGGNTDIMGRRFAANLPRAIVETLHQASMDQR